MLPRKLIIEWRTSVERALMVRYPTKGLYLSFGAEILIKNLRHIEILGYQSISLQKEIEICRAMRNEISARFPKASKEEKELLKQEIFNLKGKISEFEKQHSEIEDQCQFYENRIPNIPDSDVPLWKEISEFDEKCIRTNLKFVHNLIKDYNE